jgi:hypothetical protein
MLLMVINLSGDYNLVKSFFMPTNKKLFSVMVEHATHQYLKELATQERRSVSFYVRDILEEWVAKHKKGVINNKKNAL